MEEIVAGIHTWSVYSQEKGLDFNGYAVRTSAGTALIDPPEPLGGWEELDQLQPFAAVFVTNRNHSRAAEAAARRYGVPVRIHERDADSAQARADETVTGGEAVGDELLLVHAPGKSPGELAFHVPAARALIVGDVVIGKPAGALATYPDDRIDDRDQLLRTASRLAELDFDALLLCDGASLVVGGRDQLRRFVESERGSAGPAGSTRAGGSGGSGTPAPGGEPPAAVKRLLRQRARHRERSRVVRAVWVVAAFLVLAAGVAMLVLPGPALVVIPIGLAMLALEFVWAERALESALRRAESAKDSASNASGRQQAAGAAAALLALVAFVAAALTWDIPLLPFF